VPEGATAHYSVTLTTEDGTPAYRIDNVATGAPIANLGAAIRAVDSGGAKRVVARLAHLARFGIVERLNNIDPFSPLTGCLELELLDLPDDYQPGDIP